MKHLSNYLFTFITLITPIQSYTSTNKYEYKTSSVTAISLIDLEEKKQEFVLGTKRIEIPGFPFAFNPSIIRWNGSLLLCFRDIPNPKTPFFSFIYLVWLNDDFTPKSTPQVLHQLSPWFPQPSRAEDARLIKVGERLYIVYSDNKEKDLSRGGFRVYIAELKIEKNDFNVISDECLSIFEGESKQKREKNWVPFDYHNNLLLAYSLTPHVIFNPLLGTGQCETFATSNSELYWDWGDLRGGTTALKINDSSYLSFFHSSKDMQSVHSDGKVVSHYFMGAYIYDSEPPFKITNISPEPIVAKNFYNGTVYKPYWKPIRCVFPCGYIVEGDDIWVTYGRQDHEMWVVKIDKPGLLRSLIPVDH